VNSLSNVNFNSNLGANNAAFASMALSGTAPSVLSFTGGPFNYDPSQGNLLLDNADYKLRQQRLGHVRG
jgi:hypothetical protein